jgi:hypothetical protein
MQEITGVCENSKESVDVYLTHAELGELRLTISPDLLVQFSFLDGADWAGPVYSWAGCATVEAQAKEAFERLFPYGNPPK